MSSGRGRSAISQPTLHYSPRHSPHPSPHPSPLSSQCPSYNPSPERPVHLVQIRSDVPVPSRHHVAIDAYFSPYTETISVPGEYDLAESEKLITQVLGKSRSVNTSPGSVKISSGKICPNFIYIL